MAMSIRRCDNWLDTFMDWTLPRSEAKESLLYWIGLFTLAATVGRRVKIGKKYLGGWEAAPTMYVVFVGPQGKIKKSTTISFGESLLDQMPELTKAPEIFTSPVIIQALEGSPDSSVYCIAGEFGALMEKDDKLYTTLTNLFDHKKNISEETIGRGAKFVTSPAVSLIGATTPDWISMNMGSAVLGTGFGSRVIYIYENEVRQRRLFYNKHNEANAVDFDKLETDLVFDLAHIRTMEGEFEITSECEDKAEQWYQDNCEPPFGTPKNMVGFYNRRPAHVAKVAMLHKLAHSDELILEWEDWEKGIQIIDDIIPSITKTFKNVGKHEYVADVASILEYITENGRVEHPQLLRTFSTAARPDVLELLIQGLRDAEMIVGKMENKRLWYYPNNANA